MRHFLPFEDIRGSETGSAHPTTPSPFRTSTANERIKKSCPRRGRVVNTGQRSQSFSFGISDLFLGRAAN